MEATSSSPTDSVTSGLQNQVMRAGLWSGISYGLTRMLALLQNVILARLLLPADFGLMGIAGVALSTMHVFTQFGLDTALIQRQTLTRDVLSTAWIMSIARGAILSLLLFLAAPLIAWFFGNESVKTLIMVLSGVFLVDGFSNIGIVLFRRELNLRTYTLFQQAVGFSSALATIGLALLWRNVWALVIGGLVGSTARMVLSYCFCSYRPTVRFDWTAFRELMDYGRHILGAGVLVFILSQWDNAFVGKILGVEALGFYALAYNLSGMASSGISSIISTVAFPAYAKIQSDPALLKEGYLKNINLTALLVLPLSGGLLILAPDIVRGLYGDRWLPMVTVLRILCVFGVLTALNTSGGDVFKAIRRPEIVTHIAFVQLILVCAVIYPLTKWIGLAGVGLAITMANGFAFLRVAQKMRPIIGSYRAYLRPLGLPISGVSAMIVGVAAARQILGSVSPWWLQVLGLVLTGVIVYTGVTLLIDKETIARARALAKYGRIQVSE